LLIAVLTTNREEQQETLDQDKIMSTPADHEGKDEHHDKDLNKAAAISSRLRVFSENAEFLLMLSSLIEDFTMSVELSDCRKFPECRLAKINVNSVTAFD
jgi:hypothetical protein